MWSLISTLAEAGNCAANAIAPPDFLLVDIVFGLRTGEGPAAIEAIQARLETPLPQDICRRNTCGVLTARWRCYYFETAGYAARGRYD
jgi:hypothetical protein